MKTFIIHTYFIYVAASITLNDDVTNLGHAYNI